MKIQKAFCIVLTIAGKRDWPPAAKKAASQCLQNLVDDDKLSYHSVLCEMVSKKAGSSALWEKLQTRDGADGRPLPAAKRARHTE